MDIFTTIVDQRFSQFSEEVQELCKVGSSSCMMPVNKGTKFFIFMATLYIVTELNKSTEPHILTELFKKSTEPHILTELFKKSTEVTETYSDIRVFSPFVPNEKLQLRISPYLNTIEYDFTNHDPESRLRYERTDQLSEIIRTSIMTHTPRKAFCIVPITLTGNDSKHSNTLIIFRDSDNTLKAIIVEPHGFKKSPYGYNDEYYQAIIKLLEPINSRIELLNNVDIFTTDDCQGELQRDVVFAIDNPDTDGLMITKGMCTTLSALLTLKYIYNIIELKELDIATNSSFFSCRDIIAQGYGAVTKLNKDILIFGVHNLMQVHKVYPLRSGGPEQRQTEQFYRMFGGIFDLNTTRTTELDAGERVKYTVNKRHIGQTMLGEEYIMQLFTDEKFMKITPEGVVDKTPEGVVDKTPKGGSKGGYLKLKRKTKKNKKRSNKKRYKKYSQHIKRNTRHTKRKSKQKIYKRKKN